MNSLSVTQWYLDKNLYVTVLGMILPSVSAKLGIQLDPVKVAGILFLAATFVASHSWKSGSILLKELEQKALAAVTSDGGQALPPPAGPIPPVRVP